MMQSLYRKYNLNKKANKLFLDIQILGKDVLSEMSGQQFTVPLEKEVLDKYFSYYISGSTEEVLDKYIEQYIPNLAKEKKYQERGDQLTPLLSMIRTVAYDWTGIPINNIGVGPNAEKQKLTYGMYTRMLISSGVIEMHIQKMKEKEIYIFEQVYSVIEKIPFINKEQLPIVRRGLEAYFNKDYISACTILVTQFEAAIRTLAANAGHEIMRTNNMPEEGNEYASLEKLLFDFLPTDKDQSPDKERIQDIITYFQTLFTDKFGWNLRNLICHGLLPASSFNNVMADRIVHAFLTLKMIRLEKAESKV